MDLFQKLSRVALTTFLMCGMVALLAAAADLRPVLRIDAAGNEAKFALEVTDLRQAAQLEIRSQYGVALFQEDLPAGQAYRKLYNLENLGTGQYELVLVTPQREIVQPFRIHARGIDLDTAQRFERFLPVVTLTPQRQLNFSLLQTQIGAVELTLVNADGRVLYEEKLPAALAQQRRYDLAQLEPGYYLLRVKTGEHTFSRDIDIR